MFCEIDFLLPKELKGALKLVTFPCVICTVRCIQGGAVVGSSEKESEADT